MATGSLGEPGRRRSKDDPQARRPLPGAEHLHPPEGRTVLLRAKPRPPVGAFSFLIVALAAALAACGGSAPAPPTDTAPVATVRRIVSLAPNITEILFALGLGERVVGVTEFCNYPPEAQR